MVEYALLLVLIAVVSLTVMETVGKQVSGVFEKISTALTPSAKRHQESIGHSRPLEYSPSWSRYVRTLVTVPCYPAESSLSFDSIDSRSKRGSNLY